MKTYIYGMGSFDWSLNIHVWNISRKVWYVYHLIHETFDTRIVLYANVLIRVYFLTWNFSCVEPLALFVHFGQPYKTVVFGIGRNYLFKLYAVLQIVHKKLRWSIFIEIDVHLGSAVNYRKLSTRKLLYLTRMVSHLSQGRAGWDTVDTDYTSTLIYLSYGVHICDPKIHANFATILTIIYMYIYIHIYGHIFNIMLNHFQYNILIGTGKFLQMIQRDTFC